MIPSFAKELDRLYTIRWLAQQQGKEHISWIDKITLRNMVQLQGVNMAELLQLGELDNLADPGGSYVLKPSGGSANRGVFVIHNGYSLMDGKRMSFKQVVAAAKKADNVKGPWMVEELIGNGELPDNYEFYCFDGECGIIRQRHQAKGRSSRYRSHKFYDRNWQDLGEVSNKNVDENLRYPDRPQRLLETAESISSKLPWVFCRIDLYDTPMGVYYGELSMHPGPGTNFTTGWDNKLGRMWLQAEARRV